MHPSLFLASLFALSNAASFKQRAESEKLYTIELGPDDVRTVTEDEKWALKAEHKSFIDITNLEDIPSIKPRAAPKYPTKMAQTKAVKALLPKLDQAQIKAKLTTFSNFHNRYYDSTYGQESANWLLQQVQAAVTASGARNVNVTTFAHSFKQPSIIAMIRGKSSKTIIVGAHQDSINIFDRKAGRAPGADDNGSGSMTTLEAFRVLLTDSKIASGQATNTIEFHWYAGEEAGLLGSVDIFNKYSQERRDVKAMLNQDMTGFVKEGTKEVIALITDNVDATPTAYVRKVIAAYTSLPAVDTECGYGCSDHASANRVGFPAAFAVESTFEDSHPNIHTPSDTIDYVNFGHALEFAKLELGFAYELGFATL